MGSEMQSLVVSKISDFPEGSFKVSKLRRYRSHLRDEAFEAQLEVVPAISNRAGKTAYPSTSL